MEIRKYYIVNANNFVIIAFKTIDQESRQTQESNILPAQKISKIEWVLNRSQTEDKGEINRWLI